MAPFDSYRDLIIEVCSLFQPKNILEYGPGGSTSVFLQYSEAHIHSIEHEHRWFQEAENQFRDNDRVTLHYIKDHDEYISSDFGLKYDLIFVDGLCAWRVDCLREAVDKLAPDGYVMLHDSERTIYKEGTDLYEEIMSRHGTSLFQPILA